MKRGKHPTTKRRNAKQKLKVSFSKLREQAQLEGIIPTEPAGAVRNEVVDPASQDEQRFPGLERMAIRCDGNGWSVPEHVKRKVIEVNSEVLFERRVVVKDGVEMELPPDRVMQQQASKVLLVADEKQWERDKPEEAGKARGGGTVQVNVFDALAQAMLAAAQARPSMNPIEARIEEVQNDGPRESAEGSSDGV